MTGHSKRPHLLRRFWRDDNGAMILLGLVFLMLMMMMGGLAVDLMRFEATRTQLQQTTDRAVLAAASLKQKLDPEDVVRDYFDKAGLSDKLQSVEVVQSFNAKSVSVTAAAEVPPFFLPLIGIDELSAPAAGTAIEKINDLEISLVLDISGSMNQSNRLTNLKIAAREFIDTIFASAQPGRTTVSIIPFSGHVNLGPQVASVFNMAMIHSTSYCMDLPPSTFASTTVSRTTSFPQAGHFDPFKATNQLAANIFFCPPSASNTVLPFSDDPATLKARIGGLIANGNTSIDLGMKWGVTLLDPASNGIVQALVSNNTVKPIYDDRPLNTQDRDVLKVVVLMTDGENTEQSALLAPYRTGLSHVYQKTATGELASFFDRAATTDDYYMPATNSWSPTPFNLATGWVQMTWPEVFAYASLPYVSWNLVARPQGLANDTATRNLIRTASTLATKNTRLQQSCVLTKNLGIIVFGIAFEAPVGGRTQIRACSSSAGHYYDVAGLQIQSAFRSIANQIANLRLTQ